jgi:hypothetical protein
LVSSQQTKGYLSTVISAVVTEDWSPVIRGCEVESWKEALAAVLTYTKNEEFPTLCGKIKILFLSWWCAGTYIFIFWVMMLVDWFANILD